jgi:hypothetical protein
MHINKQTNNLSPQTIEHKNNTTYDAGNPCPGEKKYWNATLEFRNT